MSRNGDYAANCINCSALYTPRQAASCIERVFERGIQYVLYHTVQAGLFHQLCASQRRAVCTVQLSARRRWGLFAPKWNGTVPVVPLRALRFLSRDLLVGKPRFSFQRGRIAALFSFPAGQSDGQTHIHLGRRGFASRLMRGCFARTDFRDAADEQGVNPHRTRSDCASMLQWRDLQRGPLPVGVGASPRLGPAAPTTPSMQAGVCAGYSQYTTGTMVSSLDLGPADAHTASVSGQLCICIETADGHLIPVPWRNTRRAPRPARAKCRPHANTRACYGGDGERQGKALRATPPAKSGPRGNKPLAGAQSTADRMDGRTPDS